MNYKLFIERMHIHCLRVHWHRECTECARLLVPNALNQTNQMKNAITAIILMRFSSLFFSYSHIKNKKKKINSFLLDVQSTVIISLLHWSSSSSSGPLSSLPVSNRDLYCSIARAGKISNVVRNSRRGAASANNK